MFLKFSIYLFIHNKIGHILQCTLKLHQNTMDKNKTREIQHSNIVKMTNRPRKETVHAIHVHKQKDKTHMHERNRCRPERLACRGREDKSTGLKLWCF